VIGSRTSKRNAILGFLLITALVLGGMTWATVSTLRLARADLEARVREEHQRHLEKRRQQIRSAISRVEDVYKFVLAVENGRPYRHYVAYSNPPAARGQDGVPVNPRSVYLESPLVEGRSADWIDFYFQIDPEGLWTSPQIIDPSSRFSEPLAEQEEYYIGLIQDRLCHLSESLPCPILRPRVTAIYELQYGAAHEAGVLAGLGPDETDFEEQPPLAVHSKTSNWQAARRKNLLTQQLGKLAQSSCEPADVVQSAIREGAFIIDEIAATVEASVEPKGLVPFWWPAPSGNHDLLMFIREVRADDEQFYQGFTVRWDMLKPKLIAALEDSGIFRRWFPGANLEIVADARPEDYLDETFIDSLSVRLTVPDPPQVPMVASGAAWQSVRGTLLTTWLAAIGILIVAGIGFRNLVALTERRLQFAYAVTHELRTPLTTFQLYADMLAAGLVPEQSKQEYLETLNQESHRLADLVEGVLEYARLENHKVRLNPVDTDSGALVGFLREKLEEQCKRNDVRLVVENEIENGHSIRTDTELVGQIIGVLVSNACRYARGSRDPMIMIHLARQDHGLQFDVIDSGRGIERSDARQVFKPFRRGEKAKASALGGIGLGLALARTWARLLNGRLELAARSHPKLGGAHFRLTVRDTP
jgi:signal transduction histidine kinase